MEYLVLNVVEICSGQPQDEAVLGQFGDVPFQSHMMLDFMLFVSQPLTFVLLIFISLRSLHYICCLGCSELFPTWFKCFRHCWKITRHPRSTSSILIAFPSFPSHQVTLVTRPLTQPFNNISSWEKLNRCCVSLRTRVLLSRLLVRVYFERASQTATLPSCLSQSLH